MLYKGYIKTKGKKAIEAFKDRTKYRTYDEVKTNHFIFDKYKHTFYSVCCTKIFAGNLLPAIFYAKLYCLLSYVLQGC